MTRFARQVCSAVLQLVVLLVFSALLTPQETQPTRDDLKFRTAVAHYDSKQYAAAQRELEPLLARQPESFEINQLLGLALAAQGLDGRAITYLEKAARLNSRSSAAHSVLAASLTRLARPSEAETEFKKAVALEPGSFDTTTNLGELHAR